MKNIIWILLTAMPLQLMASNGDICGFKRNPDTSSQKRSIPLTQAECDERAKYKTDKKNYNEWRSKILTPSGIKLNQALNKSQKDFYEWTMANKNEFIKYGKMGYTYPRQLFTAYQLNVNNVFKYYVTYKSGEKGVNEFIQWFNRKGGFDLNQWIEICGKDHLKWNDCKGVNLKESEQVKIETYSPYGGVQYVDKHIYFGVK